MMTRCQLHTLWLNPRGCMPVSHAQIYAAAISSKCKEIDRTRDMRLRMPKPQLADYVQQDLVPLALREMPVGGPRLWE